MNDIPTGRAASLEEHHLVEQFLYREAALLDRREYLAWLRLVTDDISYEVMGQLVRDTAEGNVEVSIIEEDLETLTMRVQQIATPKLTHAENPASLVRRFVSNVRVSHGPGAGEFTAEANLLIYRNRSGALEGSLYAGDRRDVLRRVDGELRLARRYVVLAQSVYGGSMTTLF